MGSGSEGGAQNRSGHLEEHVQRAWGGTSTGIRGAGRRPEVAGPGRGRGRSEAENGASRGWDPAGPCRKPAEECDLWPESQREPGKASKEESGLEAEGHSPVGVAGGLLAAEWRMDWRALPRGSCSNAA